MTTLDISLVGKPDWVLKIIPEITQDLRYRYAGHVVSGGADAKQIWQGSSVVILQAAYFLSPKALGQFIQERGGGPAVWVMMPSFSDVTVLEPLKKTGHIQGVIREGEPLTGVLERLWRESGAMFMPVFSTQAPMAGAGVWAPAGGMAPLDGGHEPGRMIHSPMEAVDRVEGVTVLTDFNLAGGEGKTTIGTNLAAEVRMRGGRALLVGLNTPDDIPLILGMNAQRNITYFCSRPDADGLRDSIQQVTLPDNRTIDVVGGFPNARAENPLDLRRLVETARSMGYDTVIFDLSADNLVVPALRLTNRLVLVAKTQLCSALRTGESYRLAQECMGPEMAKANTVMMLVQDEYPVEDWINAFARTSATALEYIVVKRDPEIARAQNEKVLPLFRSREFAGTISRLVARILPDLPSRDAARATTSVMKAPGTESRGGVFGRFIK